MGIQGRPNIQKSCQILPKAIFNYICSWCCNWNSAGIRVRHKLADLFEIRRRRIRWTARNRGSLCIFYGIGVSGSRSLGLGQNRQEEASFGNFISMHRHAPERRVDYSGKLLHADSRRIPAYIHLSSRRSPAVFGAYKRTNPQHESRDNRFLGHGSKPVHGR